MATKVEVKTITPAYAKTLLATQRRNRKLVHSRVRVLAEAITRGEWVIDGNPIRLDEKGCLVDGQQP